MANSRKKWGKVEKSGEKWRKVAKSGEKWGIVSTNLLISANKIYLIPITLLI